jgi:hypothetical protein
MRSVSRQQIKSPPLYTRRKYLRRDRLTGELGGPQHGFGRFRNETNMPPPTPPPSPVSNRKRICQSPSCSIATIIRKIQNVFLFVESSGRQEEVEQAVLWSAQPRSCLSRLHYRQLNCQSMSNSGETSIHPPPLSFSWKQQRMNKYKVHETAVFVTVQRCTK